MLEHVILSEAKNSQVNMEPVILRAAKNPHSSEERALGCHSERSEESHSPTEILRFAQNDRPQLIFTDYKESNRANEL